MLRLIVYENGCEKQTYTYSIEKETTKKIIEMIDTFLTKPAEESLEYFQVRKQDRTERISLKQVRYFVSDRRKLKAVFTSSDDSIEFYMKMKDAEEQLHKAEFLRCHQSYLVNMRHILYWDDNNITLTGNEMIPISRKYKSSVIERLSNSK